MQANQEFQRTNFILNGTVMIFFHNKLYQIGKEIGIIRYKKSRHKGRDFFIQ